MNEEYILGKDLTIEEIGKQLKKLKFRLVELGEKLKIGFFEIKAITWKDIVSRSGYKGDSMLRTIIKQDDTREEFDAVKESYESYRALLIEKLGDMLESKSTGECITYFRDTLRWKWDDISKMFNYSVSHCKRLRIEYKKSNEP